MPEPKVALTEIPPPKTPLELIPFAIGTSGGTGVKNMFAFVPLYTYEPVNASNTLCSMKSTFVPVYAYEPESARSLNPLVTVASVPV